jgi:hypothetical protein
MESVSYEEYLKYKSLSDEEIRKMANGTNTTYNDAKDIVDIVLYIGDVKYG